MRLDQWSGRDYEGEIPTTGPTPVTVGPTTEEDRTDTIDELEESLDAGDDWEAEEVALKTGVGGNADAADGVTGEGLVWTKRGWVDRDGNPVVW